MKLSDLTIEYYKISNLEEFERKRKRIVFILAIIFLSIMLIESMIVDVKNMDFSEIVGLISVGLGIFSFIYYFVVKGYKDEFKRNVVKTLINLFDKNLVYIPQAFISPSKYELSALFDRKYDKYEGEDLVKGEIDNVKFEFSDIHTQYKTKDSKGKTHWHTIFKGTFFVSEFNKNFKGSVLVYPDYTEKFFGYLANSLQKINFNNLEFVKMDSPAFEKEFKVYASDQILARYILSNSLMEKIVKFKNLINKPLYFSFRHNMMFVAISGNNNFEPPIFRSVYDYDYVIEMLRNFYFIITLTRQLSLNRKIWKLE